MATTTTKRSAARFNSLAARYEHPETDKIPDGETGFGRITYGSPTWARGSEWFRRPENVEIPRHKAQKITSLKRLAEFKPKPEVVKTLDVMPGETPFSPDAHDRKVRDVTRSIQDRLEAHFRACRIKTARKKKIVLTELETPIKGGFKPGIVGLDVPREYVPNK